MTTPAPPTLTSIICRTAAPRAILDFSWTPNDDYTGPFTIVVQDAAGKVIGQTGGQVFGGSWNAPIDMDVNATFFAIVQTSDPNIATAPTLVLVTKFTGLVTDFDGKRLVMTWSDPTGPRPERAQPSARAKVAVQTFATIDNVHAASVEPSSFILPPAEPWWGQVAPVTGIATGPVSTPATLLKTTPAVSALSCAVPGAGGVEVDLITPNDAAYKSAPSFAVTLYADDWPLESRPAVVAAKQADGSWRIPYPLSTPWPLPGGANYRFGLRQTTATATGPEGPRLPLPAAAPVVESVAYQPASGTVTTDTLKLVLRAPPGVPYATGARITLSDAAKAPQASVLLSGFSGSVQVPKLSGTAYSMAVATAIGPAVGLPGTDTVDLLLAAPALSVAHYDQDQLHATWTAPASGNPSAFLLTVRSQGAIVASGQFGGTSGRLNVPAGTLTVEVNALTARAAGPASPPLTLIVEPPGVSGLAFNTDQSASVTLVAGQPTCRIRYEVINDGRTLKEDTLPAGTTVIPVAAVLLRPDQEPTIRVRYVSAGSAPEAAGPWSVPLPLLAKAPVAIRARYDGAIVDLQWEAVASSLVTGYQVQILADGQPAGDPLNTGGTQLTVEQLLDRGKRNTVVVRAVAGAASGPASVPLNLMLLAPAITTAGYNGRSATVAWNAIAGATGYAVRIGVSGGSVLAEATVSGTSATLLVTLDAAQTVEASVRALITTPSGAFPTNSAMGPAATARLLSAAPGISMIAVSASQVVVTLDTTASSGEGAVSYEACLYAGDRVVAGPVEAMTSAGVTAATFVFVAQPQAAYVARAWALGALAANQPGPATLPHRLPTARAVVQQAGFNAGAMTVSATWLPLPGVTAYRVALVATKDDTATEVANTSAAAGATQATVAFPGGYTLDASTQYSVLVQGLWGADVGPQGNQMPIFEPGFYVSTTAATNAPPFTYPATLISTTTTANNAMTGQPLVLYLPDVGAGQMLAGLPVTQGALTLATNGDTKNNTVYPYLLNIANSGSNNPWTFAPAQTLRTGLASDVQTFLTNAETAGVVPWGITLLQQVIGRMLPQTFAELLYYNFGLSFPGVGVTQGYVDLRPGMVLRVVPNPYQTVPGQASWLSGYGGGACIDYDVGSLISPNGAWSAGFDNFIGQLVGNGALAVNPPAASPSTSDEQGVAESADLYFPAFAQSFYRLFVPATLPSPSNTGSTKANLNFVLAAAPSYTSLSNTTSAPSANTTVAYFLGRTVLKACLRVVFDGVGRVVPVGTTLANLLEQSGRLGPAVPAPLVGVRLERGMGGAVLDPTLPSRPAAAAVHLDWQAANASTYGPGWGVASMPLLPGDRITLG